MSEKSIVIKNEANKEMYEYSWFIEKIKENLTKFTPDAAVYLAIEFMPDHFEIKKTLTVDKVNGLDKILENYSKTVAIDTY